MRSHRSFYLSYACCVVLFCGIVSSIAVASQAPIRIQTFSTHSRLSFRLDPGVEATWKSDNKGFHLDFKSIGMVDLGAPFGNEKAWLKRYQDIGDRRLLELKLAETKKGLQIKGVWKFPQGDQAPAYPDMETFTFRVKEPPQFVVDFWVKDGPSWAEVRIQREREKKLAALKKAREEARERARKRKEKKKRKMEAADAGKLCREPLNEKQNFFLPFHAVHRKVNFTKWFPHTLPDRDYQYLDPKGNSKEAEYVRLILKYFRESKYGLAVRTIDFLKKDFPKSSFLYEMNFLKSNAMMRLGHREEAFEILRNIVTFDKDSPVAIHAGKFLAGVLYHEKKYLPALESFLSLIRQHPGHRLNWVFHLGAAESLYALKQVDRAIPEYTWILEHATSEEAQAKAGLRLGDLYMERRQYAQAIAAYYKALRQFKKQATRYPEIYLNRGEAFYWLGQYDRSAREFEYFLEKYPGNEHGWRATYRLGEIFGRRSGNDNVAASRKWFFNTVNKYPFSKGAVLARLRLLPCGDHGEMNLETATRFYEKEAKGFTGENEVFDESYQDYRYVNFIKYLIVKKREDLAAKELYDVIDGRISSRARQLLGDAFKVVFVREIEKLLKEEKKYEALAFFDRYFSKLPKVGKPISSDVFLALSRSAADIELTELSERMLSYFDERRKNRKIAKQNEDSVLDNEIKKSEVSYTRSKADWVDFRMNGKKLSALEKKNRLAKIETGLRKVVDESPFSYRRELIFSMIDYQSGNGGEALRHAVNAQLLMTKYSPRLDLEVDYWISILQEKANQLDAAVKTLTAVERVLSEMNDKDESKLTREIASFDEAVAIGVPRIPGLQEVIEKKADLFEKMGRWGEVAAAYSRLVELGDKSNRVRFAYSRALGKTGKQNDNAQARKILEEISQSEQEDFWKKLAQEALENPDT